MQSEQIERRRSSAENLTFTLYTLVLLYSHPINTPDVSLGHIFWFSFISKGSSQCLWDHPVMRTTAWKAGMPGGCISEALSQCKQKLCCRHILRLIFYTPKVTTTIPVPQSEESSANVRSERSQTKPRRSISFTLPKFEKCIGFHLTFSKKIDGMVISQEITYIFSIFTLMGK